MDSALSLDRLRAQMCEAALQLDAAGLNRGSTGNVSVRWGAHWLVTPSGVPAQALRSEEHTSELQSH